MGWYNGFEIATDQLSLIEQAIEKYLGVLVAVHK